jgi:hypothetical protein
MNGPSWRSRVTGALVLVVAIALVARVIWELLGPLVPGLVVLLVVGSILISIFRGPRAGGGLFK